MFNNVCSKLLKVVLARTDIHVLSITFRILVYVQFLKILDIQEILGKRYVLQHYVNF